MSGCIHVDRAMFSVLQSENLTSAIPLSDTPSGCPSAFRNKFSFEIHDTFLSLIAPLTELYSFYATSTYAILDAETAYDVESKRAEFPIALLAAVAAEMGMVGLGDANGGDWLDEGEVLTVERMQRDMIEWEEWKQKKKLLDGQETQDSSENEVRCFLR